MPPQEDVHGERLYADRSVTIAIAEDPKAEEEKVPQEHEHDDLDKKKFSVHPTSTLLLLNLLDMFSVALVVPLLNQYYRDAGISSASTREMLSSLFSTSQIVGAIIMAYLSDSGVLSRKRVLYVSFLGSALSYSLIVSGDIRGLVVSRIVVGTVKQTSTTSTSMLATYTTPQDRTRYMGRLSACATMAFILGPSVGGFLYKHVDERAPAVLAAIIFVFNFFLASMLLPDEDQMATNSKNPENTDDSNTSTSTKPNKFSSFTKNLKTCFTSKELSSVVLSTLLYGFIMRATSYASMASYYEEMFNIEPHQRGYLTSYQSGLAFLFQTFCVQNALQYLGGEYHAACIAAGAIATATALELSSNFHIFICIICPIVAISNSLLRLSLRSLLTQVAPKETLGSVLAAMDVLQNACSVSVPFYRTMLFHTMTMWDGSESASGDSSTMKGDPCPKMWLKSSLIHWAFAAVLMTRLLVGDSYKDRQKLESVGNSKKTV